MIVGANYITHFMKETRSEYIQIHRSYISRNVLLPTLLKHSCALPIAQFNFKQTFIFWTYLYIVYSCTMNGTWKDNPHIARTLTHSSKNDWTCWNIFYNLIDPQNKYWPYYPRFTFCIFVLFLWHLNEVSMWYITLFYERK